MSGRKTSYFGEPETVADGADVMVAAWVAHSVAVPLGLIVAVEAAEIVSVEVGVELGVTTVAVGVCGSNMAVGVGVVVGVGVAVGIAGP